jgi:hypothetical protein
VNSIASDPEAEEPRHVRTDAMVGPALAILESGGEVQTMARPAEPALIELRVAAASRVHVSAMGSCSRYGLTLAALADDDRHTIASSEHPASAQRDEPLSVDGLVSPGSYLVSVHAQETCRVAVTAEARPPFEP